ncbi:MAG: pilus assembly protein TadG-related protein [Bacillota bacterium]
MRLRSFVRRNCWRAVFALRRDQRGNVVVLVAAALTVLVGFGGLVLDYGRIVAARANLHNATDAAALAGTEEYAMTNGNWSRTVAVAQEYLLANADPDPDGWNFCN